MSTRAISLLLRAAVGAVLAMAAPGCAASPQVWRPPTVPAHRASPAGQHPEATGELAVRLERAAHFLRERGARIVGERWVGFVPPEATAGFTLSVEREQCLGFVAVGWPTFADLDLTVHNSVGARIAEDLRRDDAVPWARVCVRAGERLRVQVAAVQGAGEVGVLTVLDPPLVAPALGSLLDARPAAAMAGPRVTPTPLGEDRTEVPAEQLLQRAESHLAALGLRPVPGARAQGRVEGGQADAPEVRLEAGHCYHLVAVGGAGIDELVLRLIAPDNTVVTEDTDAGPAAHARYCAAQGGVYHPVLRSENGAGFWAMALWELGESVALPPSLVGSMRALAAEALAEGRGRGMRLVRGPWRAVVAGAAPSRVPLGLRAGRCYTVTVLSGRGLSGVELVLFDAQGRVLSADTRVVPAAHVAACVAASSVGAVEVRPGATHGQWLFLAMETEG